MILFLFLRLTHKRIIMTPEEFNNTNVGDKIYSVFYDTNAQLWKTAELTVVKKFPTDSPEDRYFKVSHSSELFWKEYINIAEAFKTVLAAHEQCLKSLKEDIEWHDKCLKEAKRVYEVTSTNANLTF